MQFNVPLFTKGNMMLTVTSKRVRNANSPLRPMEKIAEYFVQFLPLHVMARASGSRIYDSLEANLARQQ